MLKTRIVALFILILGVLVALFVYQSEIDSVKFKTTNESATFSNYPFKLGLDLSGGTHLVYRADVSNVASGEVKDAMSSLRDVIERRINIFGVSEPVVTVENAGFSNLGEERLSIDLPGITDTKKAIDMIGQTPLLEFKTEGGDLMKKAKVVDGQINLDLNSQYQNTELTGRFLEKAILEFNPNTGEPTVALQFNSDGAKLFEQITRDNVGKTVAIFLDGQPISTPVVREAISGGKAVISGNFNPKEAKQLVGRLNSGALPVPIELVSTQTIGPSLGAKAVDAGVKAGIMGFLAIAIFLIIWYRMPGVIAVIALSVYVAIMLALFKLIPVTLTAAGIAGFIISLGIAVDANVLIFERLKEELRSGRTIDESIRNGFSRAWLSIRDSNTSSIITAIILYWFGTTLIKGFALTFLLGVLVSMISAISITRLFIFALHITKSTKLSRFLFGSGFSFKK